MVDNIIAPIGKKTWYKWSFYVNVILFLIVGVFIVLLVLDSYNAGFINAGTSSKTDLSNAWLYVARDIGFLSVAFALIFFQFFKNLLTIMRRSL